MGMYMIETGALLKFIHAGFTELLADKRGMETHGLILLLCERDVRGLMPMFMGVED